MEALLLEQGRVADAEAIYRADLGLDDNLPRPYQHPNNAIAGADVAINASCYCRNAG